MRPSIVLLLIAAAGLLGGCGADDGGGAAAAAPVRAAHAGTPADDAGGLPPPDCPAEVDPSLPGPDIAGLRLGMARADALNAVRCRLKDVDHIEFADRWLPRLQSYAVELGPQAFTARSGDTEPCVYRSYSDMQRCGAGNKVWTHVDESITVAAPGIPGRETVVGIWRTQNFREGGMPAETAVIAALTEKYGPPQEQQKNDQARGHRGGWAQLRWVNDPAGSPMSRQNPLYHDCSRGAAARGSEGQAWRAGCGLSITAWITRSASNPSLVQELSIGMLHMENLWNYGTALQAELDGIEQARRQKEVQRASNTANVDL